MFALAALQVLASGCVSYYVSYDRDQATFKKDDLVLNRTPQELDAAWLPCKGALVVERDHGVFSDQYEIYFKTPEASSRNFYLLMSQHYQPRKITEARGKVVVSGRSVLIDVEYKEDDGGWKKAPINGTHKIDYVLPDDWNPSADSVSESKTR